MAFIGVDERRVYFEHHIGGPLTVVLLHGWGTGVRIWDVVAAAMLDAGHSVLAFDQRGCGLSDKDFPDVSIEAGARDLQQIVEHLDLSQVLLCGWSIGGAIATAAVPLLGRRCVGLASVCGATPRFIADSDYPGAPPGSAAGMVAQLRADRFNFLDWLAVNSVARDVGAASLDRMRHTFSQNCHTADASLLGLDHLDLRDIMKALPVPFLALAGAKDALVDPAIQQAAADMAADGAIEWFEECGHTPFLEDPERFKTHLLAFAERVTR